MDIRTFLGWVICGEGCFSRAGWGSESRKNQRRFRFYLAMHERDSELIELMRKELGVGSINKYMSRTTPMIQFHVGSHRSCVEKVIPYFEGILIVHKKKQFEDWNGQLLDYVASHHERTSIPKSALIVFTPYITSQTTRLPMYSRMYCD